ncbi:hypothetical protein BCR43DRAFT_240861 [Syncephalastrum racemosum]|uniref:Uncharacterized protein n=1 Tax=Syncephalastrum racemosum TaxID=13706 RepID=A0A1X2HEY1_SYNRA|nr:hypothetical protein BCR43DRAFT_240861 [Syncephalastrum racemosum]
MAGRRVHVERLGELFATPQPRRPWRTRTLGHRLDQESVTTPKLSQPADGGWCFPKSPSTPFSLLPSLFPQNLATICEFVSIFPMPPSLPFPSNICYLAFVCGNKSFVENVNQDLIICTEYTIENIREQCIQTTGNLVSLVQELSYSDHWV